MVVMQPRVRSLEVDLEEQKVVVVGDNITPFEVLNCVSKVDVIDKEKYKILKQNMPSKLQNVLVLPQYYKSKIWLCDNGTSEKEMKNAREGTTYLMSRKAIILFYAVV
ncbi:uncharacterized protein LOC122000185 [Zingiber officinale]|uniref:uncharacterized protein LOC122000185 n=1 Tax=Zingiber officinale TaxID=94328 RepID=UPI001C4CDD44|nr:uncharacterized protein LOC122000185 [Zingiber officinale]XP_042410607.1 uncharacterized protein LOC122000185 [Zingiber officinale]XP_042410608.1 uncharacterized protein LOC122000185 [Zingiber officinale]XP_042410609.1 uncharacterized protein LOC122000185 [Zingiber officinale]